jgi:hypothetical protein
MGAPKLKSPRLRVLRDGCEDLELQTTNPDFLAWDLTRARHKWPPIQDAQFLWLTFMAWAAARRTGAIETTYTFETWRDDVIEVQVVKREQGADVVDPFPEALEEG